MGHVVETPIRVNYKPGLGKESDQEVLRLTCWVGFSNNVK